MRESFFQRGKDISKHTTTFSLLANGEPMPPTYRHRQAMIDDSAGE